MDSDRGFARLAQESAEDLTGICDWRTAHPTATFAEIEAAIDERLDRLRARLLQEVALASAAAGADRPAPAWPVCPACGGAAGAAGDPGADGDGVRESRRHPGPELRRLSGLWGWAFPQWRQKGRYGA